MHRSMFLALLGYLCLLHLPSSEAQEEEDPCVCLEQFGSVDLLNPVFFITAPGDDERIFVGEQRGRIWIYDREGSRSEEPFLDIFERMSLIDPLGERGLMGLSFHPEYQENGRFFVFTTGARTYPKSSRVSEFRVDPENPGQADHDSERLILDIGATLGWHNAGEIFFGLNDDMLYIFTGDGGPELFPQNMTSLLGKALRIEVNTGDDEIPYLIPEDNPFMELEGARPEIYALGLRNPWRCSVDPGDPETGEGRGRIFCGDVGKSWCEEIDIIVSGGNYGWSEKECHFCCCPDRPNATEFFVGVVEDCTDVPLEGAGEEVLPIHWYTEWAAYNQAVTGGNVYRGSAFPELRGNYLWADLLIRDRGLQRLVEEENGSWINYFLDLCQPNQCGGPNLQHELFALAFGRDQDNEIYVLESSTTDGNQGGGVIYKLVPPENAKMPKITDAA